MNSPLQLRQLCFTKVHVDMAAEGGGAVDLQTQASLEAGVDATNPRNYLLKMIVKFGPHPGKNSIYSGEVHARAVVSVAETVELEKVPKLALVNGASMLYGAIREMVSTVSGRGPRHPALILSTMSFSDAADRMEKMPPDEPRQRRKEASLKG